MITLFWRVLTPAAVLSVAGFVQAEDKAGGDGPPPTSILLRSRYIGVAKFGDTGTKVTSESGGISADVPFPIVGDLNGSIGLSGDYFAMDFKNFSHFVPNTETPIKHGYELKVNPGLHYHYSDDWDFFSGVQWQADSADGASLGRSSMWGGNIGAAYQVNTNLTVAFGFAAATRLGYSTAYAPFAGVTWHINPRWVLSVTGDRTDYVTPVLQLAYTLNDQWTFFVRGGYETRFIRLSRSSTIPDGTMRYRAAATQVGFDYSVTKWFTATLYGGAQLGQDYKFQTSDIGLVGKHEAGASPSVGVRLNASF